MANLNPKWINLVFIIDESGSMYQSKSDVVGGYDKTIEEQKAIKDGKVTVSLYTFNSNVTEHYVGKDINDIPQFKFEPNGMTRLNDGIGTGIFNVGKWLYKKDKNGEEMPGQTMVIIMTDGKENSSKEYTLKQVKDMIKEQTEKYSWKFIYMGCDITTTKDADDLGIKFSTYGSRDKYSNNYDILTSAVSAYRCMANAGASLSDTEAVLCSTIVEESDKNTKEFEKKLGRKISNV